MKYYHKLTSVTKIIKGSPWVAQSDKPPTFDFCSGHDLTFREIEPCIRLCALSAGPAWDSATLTLSVPRLPLSLSQDK